MAQLPTHAQAFLAPAKLNLDLRIIGRRADGYHLLESIFCLIDLCDIVHLAPRTDAEIILHTPAAGVAAEQDLSYRAAKALQQAANCRLGADIWLQKNIPMGGGGLFSKFGFEGVFVFATVLMLIWWAIAATGAAPKPREA